MIWFRTLFYLIAAVVLVVCIYRLVKRNLFDKKKNDLPSLDDPPVTHITPTVSTESESVAETSVTASPEVPQPVPVSETISETVSQTETTSEPPAPVFSAPAFSAPDATNLNEPDPLRPMGPIPTTTTSGMPIPRSVQASELVEQTTTTTDDYVFGSATPLMAAMLPESDERRIQVRQELQAAGYYNPHAYQNFAALRTAAIFVPLFFFGILLIIAPPVLEGIALALMVGMPVLGWALPRLYVRSVAKSRLEEIERAMPDMLDMLNMCVSQGLTVPESLSRISVELKPVYPALAQELRIVTEQSSLGNLHQAMQNFSDRIDVPEVHSFTALMVQTERMGTSVSDSLADYSDNMRESLRQRADEKANSATFKLLFPTVLCLMPAVILFLVGPAIIEFSDFLTGGGTDIFDRSPEVIRQATGGR